MTVKDNDPQPPAPTNLRVTGRTHDGVTIVWDPEPTATAYRVQYKKTSDQNWQTDIDFLEGTSRTVTGLECDTGY